MTKIAIVVVTYNNEGTILACLQSLSLSLTDFVSQVIVVDNDSQDNTTKILEGNLSTFQNLFNEFSYIQNPTNVGFTKAVNLGLARVAGDYVLLLNPDVELNEETINPLVRCFSDFPQLGIAAPQLQFPDRRIQKSCRRFPTKRDVLFEITGLTRLFPQSDKFNQWKMADFDHEHSRFVDQPQGAFLLLREQIIKDIGLLDEQFTMFFSDVDYCKRIINAGWKIRFCAESSAIHHKGHSVYQNRKEMIKMSHISFVDYFAKYDTTFKQRVGTFFVAVLLRITLIIRLFLQKS